MTETPPSPNRRDVHRQITDHIIAAIEAGPGGFEMPWHRGVTRTMPTNVLTGIPYRGVNVVGLWAAAEVMGFGSGVWATYKQWRLLGAQVRRGEKGSIIVFYKKTTWEVMDEDTGTRETEMVSLFARASSVFNADQVDGWHPPKPIVRNPAEVLEGAEEFVAATGADIRHGGDSAYYRPSTDHIQIPLRDCFTGTTNSSATECYYATLLHELTHWTGHKDRLDRNLAKRFGDNAYAMEELVAELGAAFLCSDLGISNTPRPDHAAYLASWLAVLKKDRRAIFTAASKAADAKEFLVGLQRMGVAGAEGQH